MSVKYEIKKELATLATHGAKELRLDLISWNDRPPEYNLRLWYRSAPEGMLPGKGLILSESEARNMFEALKKHFQAEEKADLGD